MQDTPTARTEDDPVDDTSIAVISMACRFPGAPDVETYWANLRAGVESISPLDPARAAALRPDLAGQPGFVPAAGVVTGAEFFDAALFGFSRREAEVMDPQHRLFLECAWEALESAGYPPTGYPGTVGVYTGSGTNTYLLNNVHPARGALPNRTLVDSMSELQLLIGNGADFLSTRVSHRLQFTGPSINVQTACSTGLVAVHLACQALWAGECDVALAGTSALRLPQESGYLYQEDMVFSPDGHCRAFDAEARGTVFGSGVGLVMLKPLRQALRDGDIVHAVVTGTAVTNDGVNRVGFSAPGVDGQTRAITEAMGVAGIGPEDVGYVEAHGTGTALGDAVELEALNRAFAGRIRPVWLGSVKTNLGHLTWSSGIAGLIKAVLAVRNGEIPPTLHYREPNPQIDYGPFTIASRLISWPSDAPRRAGVSSFGLGGTNAHVIVEQAPASRSVQAPSDEGPNVLVLSANRADALEDLAARYGEHLTRRPEIPLGDICFTASTGRAHLPHRLAEVASRTADLPAALASHLNGSSTPGAPGPLAFLFTGQGAQYSGMARDLYQAHPSFREAIEECEALLSGYLDIGLTDLLYHPDHAGRLDDLTYAHPALFAIEYALSQLWRSWDIEPDLVLGHSAGEYAAACMAGVIDLADALWVSAMRGRLLSCGLTARGRMATVLAPEKTIRDLLEPFTDEVSIAAVNGPLSTVISGHAEAVDRLCAHLGQTGIEARPLNVSAAGHSVLVDPILDELRSLLASVELSMPRIPLASNLTGDFVTDEITRPEYWVAHTREPVRFADGMTTLAAAGAKHFVEIGPDAVLTGMGAFCLMGQDATWLPSLRRRGEETPGQELNVLYSSLARVYREGHEVDWHAFHRPRSHRRVALPTYPFHRERHWIEPPTTPTVSSTEPPRVPVGQAPAAGLDHEALVAPTWRPLPSGTPGAILPRWLIVGDPDGLGRSLATRLRVAGATEVTVFAADGAPPQMLDKAAGIVFLTSTADTEAGPTAPDTVVEAIWRACAPVLDIARRLIHDSRMARLWVVTRGAQSVLATDRARGLVQAPLWALARVLGLEHPDLRPVCVDLEPHTDNTSRAPAGSVPVPEPELRPARSAVDFEATTLVGELAADSGEDHVAFRDGQRWVQRLTRPEPKDPDPVALDPDGTYWITGGLGGLGLLLADWLAAKGARHLVLIGRRGPDRNAQSRITALERSGVQVMTTAADVSRAADVARLFEDQDRAGRPLRGIIHAAGVLDDALTEQQNEQRFRRVLAAKAQGAVLLHQHSRARAPHLNLFVLFSSAASLVGNPGQANHAAANALLDALAHHRRAEGLPAQAINWGAWTDVGALAADAELCERLTRAGFGAITAASGLAALDHCLGAGYPQMGVVPMDWARRAHLLGLEQVPYFQDLLPALERLQPDPGSVAEGRAPSLAGLEPERRREALRAVVATVGSEVLGVGQESIVEGERWSAHGLDSLAAIEIRNVLQTATGQRLPAMLLFDHPTPAAVTDYLTTLPWSDEGEPAPAPPTTRNVRATAGHPSAPSAATSATDQSRTLSAQQTRWLRLIAAGYGQRVVPIVIEAALDRDALRQALLDVAGHHELLRYHYPDGSARVLPAEEAVPATRDLFVDLRTLDDTGRAQALAELVQQCRAGMPDPAVRPPWTILCLDWADDRFLLLLSLQHLDFDGTSLTTFVEDLHAAYTARSERQRPRLEPVASYASYTQWQHTYRTGDIADDRAFFQGLYAGLDQVTALPGHTGFATTTPFAATRHTPPQRPGTWEHVRQASAQLGVTPFSVLLAPYAALVAEITGQPQAVITMITNGRPDEGFSRTVGPFTAPFPVPITTGDTLAQVAARCQQVVAAVHSRSHYPVVDLVEHVPVFRGFPEHSYFSDVGINFTNYRRSRHPHSSPARVIEILGPVEEEEFAAAASEELRRIPGLHLVIDLYQEELRFNFWYHVHRFLPDQIDAWADRYQDLLNTLTTAASPSAPTEDGAPT